MNLQLEGKKVLLTGGSKGLGRELLNAFLNEGATVVYCSRSPAKDNSNLSSHSSKVFFFPVDAFEQKSIESCVLSAEEEMNGIDILINNLGGVYESKDFWSLNETDWLDVFRLNFLSAVSFSKFSYHSLKFSSAPRIINISSVNGVKPGFLNPHYSASKAALINFTKHLAQIWAIDNILVNCVLPGPFNSEGLESYYSQMAGVKGLPVAVFKSEEEERARAKVPLKRIGQPEEVSPLVLLLASPINSWQTGSCLIVDGGKNI